MPGLGALAAACATVAVVVLLTRDPEEAWAVGVVIVALGIASGALATLLQLRAPRSGRRRASGQRHAVAARRGIAVAAVVTLLLWLRVVDGLSVITAAFVIGAFAVAEVVLSARPASPR
ncbi:MAG TPA: hypothetical protein VFC31_05840 [Candidatus Limnocylindria bacterium]|nr:hypothetical protein [Candidatus Limnocylindria bacterium]